MTSHRPNDYSKGAFLLDALRRELPDYSSRHLEFRFWRRPGCSQRTSFLPAPRTMRGNIALCAYWIGLANPGYRAIVDAVWARDHQHLVAAVKNRLPLLRRMFILAQFNIPLTGVISIYRGAYRIDRARIQRGLSWTTDRSVASWFAYRPSRLNGPDPACVVITTKIDASQLIYYSDSRAEKEVIPRTVPTAWIDGVTTDWFSEANIVSKARQTETKLRLLQFQTRRASTK